MLLGLPRLRNLVNVYTSSSNRNAYVYTELPDLILFIMQIGKIADIFPKKTLLKNLPCQNIRNCLVGCCDRTHFKLLESDCNMRRLVDNRHFLQLQVCN